MINVEAAQRVMQFIEDHPGQHCQGEWCSCYAGLLCLLSGRINLSDMQIQEMAQSILGIDGVDALILFHGTNTPDKLAKMTDDLIHGHHLANSWQVATVDGCVSMEMRRML